MVNHLFRFVLMMGMVVAAASTASLYAADVWRADYDAAYAEAVRAKRPLLVHFYGQQCPPCRRMEQEVLHQPDVVGILSTQYIAVKVDAGNPANIKGGQLVQRFGVHALPCDVIIDPLSGRLISQVEGFQDLNRYRTTAVRSRGQFDQFNQIVIVQQPQAETPPEETADPQQEITLGDPQPIVGMDGYSPVALGAERKWVLGSADFAYEYKGLTYYLANEAELKAFRTRPQEFAPRLLGCDPVLLNETDRAVQGSTDYGAFFDGDLYLFESDESRRRFKSNPLKYTRIQHVLKVDHVQRLAQKTDSNPGVK